MARTHSLDGLMKWLRRDEWREAFAEVLDHHLLPACSKADVTVEKLPSIIGEHWFMILSGCAFEDFLSRDLDDDRNIVDDYTDR